MRPPAVLVAATALACVAALGGCARDDTAAYCDALREASSEWAQAGASLADRQAASRLVGSVRTIEDAAPDDVRPDWTRLRVLFERFAVDAPDLRDLSSQLPSFEAAARKVETHAQDVCGVDLSR